MKKSILMLGLAVAAMTSCTNDEVLEQNKSTQKAIGFESFVNKGTRAVTETTSAITKFYAFGYYDDGNPATEVVFNGTTVSRTDDNSSEWTYDLDANVDDNQVAYWTKNVYQFAGYANGNEADALSNVTFANANSIPTLTITDYVVSDNNDLVVGLTSVDNAASDKSSDKVSFTFKHLLSKVKFTVINNDSKYKMRITSPLTITGVNTKGTCTITKDDGPSWTNAEETVVRNNFVPVAETAANTYIPIKNAQTNNTDYEVNSEEYFVLPQTLTDVVKFSITAKFYDNNNQVVAVKTFTGKTIVNNNDAQTPVSIATWKPGYEYHYTISLPTAAKPIEFGTPTIDGWKSEGVIELNPGDTGLNGSTN